MNQQLNTEQQPTIAEILAAERAVTPRLRRAFVEESPGYFKEITEYEVSPNKFVPFGKVWSDRHRQVTKRSWRAIPKIKTAVA